MIILVVGKTVKGATHSHTFHFPSNARIQFDKMKESPMYTEIKVYRLLTEWHPPQDKEVDSAAKAG